MGSTKLFPEQLTLQIDPRPRLETTKQTLEEFPDDGEGTEVSLYILLLCDQALCIRGAGIG